VPTHYEVLGIGEGASGAEVRHAYRRLAKAIHPDRVGDPAQFRLITQAYEVLSDPAQRAAYDRSLRPPPLAAPTPPVPAAPPRRRHYARYVVALLAALAVATGVWLVVATTELSLGDDCLVGRWQAEEFDVAFRGSLDGDEIAAPIRGGAGVTMTVAADGTVRTDYAGAAPLVGADGAYRIEGVYVGTTSERWRVTGTRIVQSDTDASGLAFRATVNGRAPDQPLGVTVVDREYPYTCTPTNLELGPYRYTRMEARVPGVTGADGN
jgi:hypothetical protein